VCEKRQNDVKQCRCCRVSLSSILFFIAAFAIWCLIVASLYHKMSDGDKTSPYHHPTGQTVDIVGIEIGGSGRNCECHISPSYCRSALHVDAVVHFHFMQIQMPSSGNPKKRAAPQVKTTMPAKKIKRAPRKKKKGTDEDEKKDEVVVVAEPEVNEEDAIGAYWVTDGIDRCLVGFLPYHLLFRKHLYDGKLAQVVEFLRESDFEADKKKNLDKKGVCRAVLIESVTST